MLVHIFSITRKKKIDNFFACERCIDNTVYTPLSRAANIDFWHTRGFGIRFIFKDAGLSGLHTCQYRVGFKKHPLAPDTFTHWIDIKGQDEHGNTCSYENKDGIFEPVVYIDGCSYQGLEACKIEVRATDWAGNESVKPWRFEHFNIDWTPPIVK